MGFNRCFMGFMMFGYMMIHEHFGVKIKNLGSFKKEPMFFLGNPEEEKKVTGPLGMCVCDFFGN